MRARVTPIVWLGVGLLAAACAQGGGGDGFLDSGAPRLDAGPGGADAGPASAMDAGAAVDAEIPPIRDAGPPGTDAGPPAMTDAGPPAMTDAGPPAMTDAGPPAMTDAGPPAMTDAGPPDGGPADAGGSACGLPGMPCCPLSLCFPPTTCSMGVCVF